MTKVWILILICALWPLDVFCQETTCDSLYTVVDKMPVYGEGKADLVKYLSSNLTFKKSCRPEELKFLTWTINTEGQMVDIDAIGLEGQCRLNVIDQLKTFPNWTPGKLEGISVCVKMTVPIHIRPKY
jgi:hypothetical protein